jgi:hypothetical protein
MFIEFIGKGLTSGYSLLTTAIGPGLEYCANGVCKTVQCNGVQNVLSVCGNLVGKVKCYADELAGLVPGTPVKLDFPCLQGSTAISTLSEFFVPHKEVIEVPDSSFEAADNSMFGMGTVAVAAALAVGTAGYLAYQKRQSNIHQQTESGQYNPVSKSYSTYMLQRLTGEYILPENRPQMR